MQLSKKRFSQILVVAAAYLSAIYLAGAATEPDLAAAERTVATLHAALVEAASSELTQTQRFEVLQPIIRATHDLPYIAELTIRRQWRELDADPRNTFVAAFEHLSVMTYVTRFAAVRADSFKILGAEVSSGGRVEVRAVIVPADADEIPIDYLLHEGNGEWRIINILANRVSDLALKRSQYQRVLNEGTIDDLVDYIESEAANQLR